MTLRHHSLAILAFVFVVTLAQADILVLKNGERKEGTILNESPDAIRMRYRLTPKIWDEKDFPKSDVAEVIRQRPEEIDIEDQGLRTLLPSPDLMSADDYEHQIQERLRPFINKYPGTPEAAEVEKIIAELQSEKEKAVSGGLKVEGKWLTAEEARRDEFNIRAFRARKQIQELGASTKWEDWVQALRLFDRFSSFDGGYSASTHYPAVIPEVLEILKKYESQLAKMVREQPILLKTQQDSLRALVEPELSRTSNAIRADLDAWKTVFETEKRARIKWLMPYKLDLPSLQEAQKQTITERTTLQSIDLNLLTAQNEQLVEVMRLITDEKPEAAQAALDKAVSIAGSNSKFSRLMGDLRTKITNLKSELTRKENAQRTFSSGATALAGEGQPVEDDRVAKALAQAQGNPVAEETPENPPAPSTPTAAVPSTPTTTQPLVPALSPSPSPPTYVDEDSFPFLPVAGAGVVLLLILILLLKRKQKSNPHD